MNRHRTFTLYLAAALVSLVTLAVVQDSFFILFTDISVAISLMFGLGLWKRLREAFRLAGNTERTPEQVLEARKVIFTTLILIAVSGASGLVLGILPWALVPGREPGPYVGLAAVSGLWIVLGSLLLLPVLHRLPDPKAAR